MSGRLYDRREERPEIETETHVYKPSDDRWRIGRCNHCAKRPAYCWKRGTIKLAEAQCLRCGGYLMATTRLYRGAFRKIDGENMLNMLGRAGSEIYTRKLEALEWMNEATTEIDREERRRYVDDYAVRHAEIARRLHRLVKLVRVTS